MTIRTRMTLWYAAIFSTSLLAIGIFMYLELVVEMRDKTSRQQGTMVDEDAGDDITQIMFIYGGSAVVVGLLGGWWLMRRALAPVAQLTLAAEKIHDYNLREQLPRTGNRDELDRLTEVFNAMTARLDDSFKRVREFTLHASHELKTPLTILHGEMETALLEKNISNTHRERLANQLDEIQRLTKIVDGLTLLTKADAGQIVLRLEPLSFDEIVRDVFADALILARSANVSVNLVACEPCMIRGDRHRLRQLLLNLADNAVKYNQPGGSIEFTLRSNGTDAELRISNTGMGIVSDVLPHVFERFFRADKSHNSAVDGCGLGLSIAQWIATAHHGSVRIESVPGQLTTVIVQLPLLETQIANKKRIHE